jgi:hypothetical protein
VKDRLSSSNVRARAAQLTVMRLLTSFLLAAISCGCASAPVSDEQRALNICLWSQDQVAWKSLSTAPAIADTLRAAIVASGQRPFPEPGEHEWWFAQSDGRYLRCTNRLGAMFEAEGMPAVCGASTHTFTPEGGSWSVGSGGLVHCNKRR